MITGAESTSPLVRRWRDYAFDAHGDQLYGNGPRFIREHLDEGAGLAERLGYPVIIAAAYYLHDVDEDTEKTIEDIQRELNPPLFIVRGLRAVTSSEKEADGPKIDRAVSDPVGQVLKAIDSAVNFSAKIHKPDLPKGKSFRSATRYAGYISRTWDGLMTPLELRGYIAQQKRIEAEAKKAGTGNTSQ